jgi:SAM-dependent methyltransferase
MSGAEERLADDPTSELWGEHRARYRFATQWADKGRDVLDMACGAGFGLLMLRAAGAMAFGVDYDGGALRGQRAVACADAAHLPFRESTFDLVTSFETLEHVPDAAAMLRELRRVLRPGGRLVLSTPNRAFLQLQRQSDNPFHVQEFTAEELRALLSECFRRVCIYGQRPSAHYRYVPFLMVEANWRPTEVAWKVLNRLPYAIKTGIAQQMGRKPWYPGEEDWRFVPDDTVGAHALLAVAS